MSLESSLKSPNNDVTPSSKKKVSFKEETTEDSTRKSQGTNIPSRLFTNINDTSAPVTRQNQSVNFPQGSDKTEVINDNDVTSTPADKGSEQSETDTEKYETCAFMTHSLSQESYIQYSGQSGYVTTNFDNSVPTSMYHYSSPYDGARLLAENVTPALSGNVTSHYQENLTRRNDANVRPLTNRPDKSSKKLEKTLLELERRLKDILTYIIIFFFVTLAYEGIFFVLLYK